MEEMTIAQKAAIGVSMLPMLEAEAKKRQRDAGASGCEGGRGHKKETLSINRCQGKTDHSNRTAHIAGGMVGVSGAVIDRMKKVMKESPEAAEQSRQAAKQPRPGRRKKADKEPEGEG